MQLCARRVSVAAVGLLCVIITVSALSATVARAFDHGGITVAGGPEGVDDVEGPVGTSRIMNPFPICANVDPTDPSGTMLLIGGASYFFTLNRFTTYLGFWFGKGKHNVNSGPIESVQLKGLYGCATLPPSSSGSSTTGTVYYVQHDGYLYWVTNNVVSMTPVGSGVNLFDVSIRNDDLYLLTSSNAVYQCSIPAGGVVTGSACSVIVLTGSQDYIGLSKSTRFKGFVVTAQGIFITLNSKLYWFALNGAFIGATLDGVRFVDVKLSHYSDTLTGETRDLVAASTSAVYSITASGTSITYTLIAGTEKQECNPVLDNVDSPTNPTFCGITRIYPLNRDSVYVTISTTGTVRAVVVANTTISNTIARTPFPVKFEDSASAMPLMLGSMDLELMLGCDIAFPNVAIDPASVALNDMTWDTTFPVHLSNRFFSDAAKATITSTTFMRSLHMLGGYYNRTNQFVFGDWNVLPMCRQSKMLSIERAIADNARAVLKYEHIYTSNAYKFTVNGQPNLTLVKLLMPSAFGTLWDRTGFVENQTTPSLLMTVDFTAAILATVREAYQPDHVYDQIFLSDQYPLHILTEAQQQEARWVIYDIVTKQLLRCAQDTPASSSDSSEDGDLVPGCVPRVGITNLTEIPVIGLPIVNYGITFFVPEEMYYNFQIKSCLDQIDWKDLLDYLEIALRTNTRKCDTGCIVGIAVVCAVVAAILVVVVVILTSKRRRLATVVAPAATSEPKFISTLDVTSEESSRNPLHR
ncbi:hypothetical protein JKF63_07625 [Porcisia hertigi]|uniref:Membrane-associated protein n=1 Tax=Porcisia hertigi TaxID=2761500 RepID=A0A836I2R8_9TRYP|nr:hypothetical protein JKF63_07625 [Porcisia hertigi]